MKLRIRGNSVRIRLSQSEMARLAADGAVEDAVAFAPGERLGYRVVVREDADAAAAYESDRVTITLPRARFERWLLPEEVSIRAEQPLGGEDRLLILVEKDFTCLTPRQGEEDSDLFPNPAAGPG